MHRDEDDLPQPLRRATELLRELPDIRPAWRRDLQASLDDDAIALDTPVLTPNFTRRRWSVSPLAAIAACLLCAVIGGVAVSALRRGDVVTPVAERTPPTRALNVRFDLVAPTASRVTIVGDFNQWNAESLPMRRSADGRRWEIEVPLPPGRYTYGFVVDGKLMRDPRAPESASDDFGIPNSVRMVSRAGGSS
jgi:hypothetical protein